MSYQAQVTLPGIVRGDDLLAKQFTTTINASNPTITDAVFTIHNVAKIPCSIAGNVITREFVPAATTAKWPVGVHKYDLRAKYNGRVRTYIAGTIPITEKQ